MVSAASLAAMFFTLLLSLFLPVGLAIYYYRKYRFSLKAFFVGAAVFFLSQIVIRTPLLVFLSSQDLVQRVIRQSFLLCRDHWRTYRRPF
ncbi:MAG: YhfC family glutamic-type intramembrane protease [Dethiobacteria bacterium]